MVELLEREHDLAVIRDGVSRACLGDGTCLVIEGPAGIGKSALLAAARELAVELDQDQEFISASSVVHGARTGP